MKITVLGCGNAWSRNLGHTSFLVQSPQVTLVLDCGPTVPERVERTLGSLKKVTHWVVTHLHADHVGGLEEVAFKNYFLHGRYLPHLLHPENLKSILWTNYLSATCRDLAPLVDGKDVLTTLGSYFTPYAAPYLSWVAIADLAIVLYPTTHVGRKPNASVLIREIATGKQVLFSGDVIGGQKLPLKSADLVFHDCTFAPKYEGTVHTHCEELLQHPYAVREKMVCVHYSDDAATRRPLLDVDITPLTIATPGQSYDL